jgi:hypothetical protein
MGLAIAAAAGAEWLNERWRASYVTALLVALTFGDLWYWNSFRNPLAYGRQSFDKLYGAVEMAAGASVAGPQLPLSRFESPGHLSGLGPMLHPLDLKFETTYGYLAAEPQAYSDYRNAMQRNPKLRNGLNVSRFLNFNTGSVDVNPGVLPRAYFPRTVRDVSTEQESRRALETLDPAAEAVVLGPHEEIRQDPMARSFITANGEQSCRVHYQAAAPSLLKLAVNWFPGWRAIAAGRSLPILRVDHTLMGVAAPPGEGDVDFYFRSNYFGIGAAISVFTLVCLMALVWIKHMHRITGRRGGRVRVRRKTAAAYSS